MPLPTNPMKNIFGEVFSCKFFQLHCRHVPIFGIVITASASGKTTRNLSVHFGILLTQSSNYINGSGHGSDTGTFSCIWREKKAFILVLFTSTIQAFGLKWIWIWKNIITHDARLQSRVLLAVFYIATEEIVQKLGNFKPVSCQCDEKYLEDYPFEINSVTNVAYSAEGVLHQMKNIIKRFPKLFPIWI